jgi:hypothetical protein
MVKLVATRHRWLPLPRAGEGWGEGFRISGRALGDASHAQLRQRCERSVSIPGNHSNMLGDPAILKPKFRRAHSRSHTRIFGDRHQACRGDINSRTLLVEPLESRLLLAIYFHGPAEGVFDLAGSPYIQDGDASVVSFQVGARGTTTGSTFSIPVYQFRRGWTHA